MAEITVGNTEGGANDYDVATGAGNVADTVQRVTLAADDPAVVDLAALEVLSTAANALLTTIDGDTSALVVDAAAIEVLLGTIDADTSNLAAILTAVGRYPKSGTAVAKTLASGTSSAEYAAANTDRNGLTMTNTDANRCYVNVGAAASTTAFIVYLDEGDYYELPAGLTGQVNAIWTADGSGSLIGQEAD